MTHHLMLVPSLACPASCRYCFGPHMGAQTMSRRILEAVVRWQKNLNASGPLEITFHGGEPLVPGSPFYREALPLLKEGLAPRRVRFAMQSNLWLLNDELCELFREYRVSVGTSLDDPPLDCSVLHNRARSLLMSALRFLNITEEEWHGIGFDIPGKPSILVPYLKIYRSGIA